MSTLPRNFLWRVAGVAVLLLAAAHWLADGMVAAALPAIRAEIGLIERNIDIGSLALTHKGGSDLVTLNADLAYPLYLGAVAVNPLGWHPGGHGYFQVRTSARGMLLAPLVMLLGLLAWPAATARAMLVRLAIGLPLLVVLMAMDTPLDLLGTFLHSAIHHAGLSPTIPLFVWAQFIEGGGSIALALAMAVATISAAGRLCARA